MFPPVLLTFLLFSISHIFRKKIQGHNRIRTNDRGNCSPTLYHWAMRPLVLFDFSFFPTCAFSFFSTTGKKTPPVGLEPTTLRLKAARSTDWARKALAYLISLPLSIYPPPTFLFILLFVLLPVLLFLYISLIYLFTSYLLNDNVAEWSKACD